MDGKARIMRVRTVIVGIAVGLLCFAALWFQYYRVEPAKIVPGWPLAARVAQLPGWTSIAVFIFCGVTLFTGGWVAARWNWADHWRRSLQMGAGMGLLAGCIIFDFIGIFWLSVKGQTEILQSLAAPIAEGMGEAILVQAILQTGAYLSIGFVLVMTGCTLIGGFGGVTSALLDRNDIWGTDPRNPEGWLFRLPAYLLSISGLFYLLIGIAVMSWLQGKLLATAVQLREGEALHSSFMTSGLFDFFNTLTLWVFAFLPIGLTWGWVLRIWTLRKRLSFLSVFWMLLIIVGFGSMLWWMAPEMLSRPLNIIALAFAALTGIFIGFVTEERAEGFPYRFSDWVGFGLGYGILSGTQFVAGLLAYSVALALLTIPNMPYLTGTGPLNQSPLDQVVGYFTRQTLFTLVAIAVSIALGLALASFVSFLRTIFGTQDAASARD